jgi:ribonuclease E
MLDNTEPTESATDTSATDNRSTGSTGEPAAAAPAKKAARKAPAKRAPRKTAAKKAAAPAEAGAAEAGPAAIEASGPSGVEPAGSAQPEADESGAQPEQFQAAPEQQSATEPAPVLAPAKKTTRARKAPAKKVAKAAASEPAAIADAGPGADTEAAAQFAAPQPAAAQVAPETATSEPTQPTAETSAPVKKTTRRRTSKAAAAAAATEAAAGEAAAADLPVAEMLPTVPALAVPTVLFQPPSEGKAPPRRRRGAAKAAPVQPAAPEPALEDELATEDGTDLLPVLDAEVESDLETVPDADAAVDSEADNDAEVESEAGDGTRRRRRRGRRGRGSRGSESADSGDLESPDVPSADVDNVEDTDDEPEEDHAEEVAEAALSASARRRRRRRRSTGADGTEATPSEDDPPNTVVHVRDSRGGNGAGKEARGERGGAADDDGVRGVRGSTRLEAKRQRRRDNRDSGRRRAPILSEAEFLARRESVDRVMAVRQTGDRTQIAVLEDDILVEHYVTRASASSAVGNVYLGRVQNVLPSMEAAFIDIGRGRNGVLYAGEVNWDTAGLEGKGRSIENALNAGDMVLVQVTKDPIGHKGARLTSQISLPGRFVVYVPGGGMTGISRKLPDVERSRLKAILKKVVPDEAGVIVRTAAEGASEQDLISDVERLQSEWESISRKTAKAKQTSEGPSLVHGEPDLAIRVVRDIFNDDFGKLIVAGSGIHATISDYVSDIAAELADRISLHTSESDLFRDLRVDEQLAKALDRKVWLPSGGSLVIDRTEAMTVVDVNTGKYTGSGGNLEQTVTRNNLEAAEELVRQLRLRDIGGIVVIDFIDMVLESNRDLVLRRLTECLGRDRTKHQVAEVTSLGLVQMTRKRVGEGLLEAFSEPCVVCNGRGVIVHLDSVEKKPAGSGPAQSQTDDDRPSRGRRGRKSHTDQPVALQDETVDLAAEAEKRRTAATAVAAIAAATGNGASSNHDQQPATALAVSRPGETAADGVAIAPAPSAAGTAESDQVAAPTRARRSRRGARAESGPPPVQSEPAELRPIAGTPVATGLPAAERVPPATEPVIEIAPPVTETVPAATPTTETVPAATPVLNGAGPAESPEEAIEQAPYGYGSAPSVAPRPRRRRAASRPAGPPVPVSATDD